MLLNNAHFRQVKKLVGQAIGDFDLIDPGDRVAVAVSGGQASLALLHLLAALRRRAPIRYDLVAVHVNVGLPGERRALLEESLDRIGFPLHVATDDGVPHPSSQCETCSACAPLRHRTLCELAERLDCNKLALGHHLDDCIETLLLNQFYAGALAALGPKQHSAEGPITLIRPLVYVEQRDLAKLARQNAFPQHQEGIGESTQDGQERQLVRTLIGELHRENRYLKRSMIRSLGNVKPRHLLDREVLRQIESQAREAG